jgi:hypothetical protein
VESIDFKFPELGSEPNSQLCCNSYVVNGLTFFLDFFVGTEPVRCSVEAWVLTVAIRFGFLCAPRDWVAREGMLSLMKVLDVMAFCCCALTLSIVSHRLE